MVEGLGGPITIGFQRGLRSPLLFYNSATKLTLSMFHHKTAVFIFTENEMVDVHVIFFASTLCATVTEGLQQMATK